MSTIQETSLSIKITYLIRNILSRPLFKLLEGNLGRTLDIGGGSFYKNLSNSTWSNYFVLEPDLDSLPKPNDLDKIMSISADAGKSPIKSHSFDTVIIIQVLQFIYEPTKVIAEANRILKKNGRILFNGTKTNQLYRIVKDFPNSIIFANGKHYGIDVEDMRENPKEPIIIAMDQDGEEFEIYVECVEFIDLCK